MAILKDILITVITTAVLTTALECGQCLYSRSRDDCGDHRHTCDEEEEYCFMQKIENEHGTVHYKGGCATKEECEFMKFRPQALGKREPLAKHTCDDCCKDRDMCNTDLCHTKSIADLFHSLQTTESTTTTTTTTTVPPVPVKCEECDGHLCGLSIFKYSFTCTHEKPYCMTTVVNAANGTKHITKGCASVIDCRTKWWLYSSSVPECQHLEINNRYPFPFTCHYCCVTDDCNRSIIPDQLTMYRGAH